ncbi:hypothetical protein MTO96_048892 [Rhipicephalus appendiculatus]
MFRSNLLAPDMGFLMSNTATREVRSPITSEQASGYGATTVTPPAGGLKREVGLFSAIAIVIGSTVGSGILVSPSLVFRNTGTIGVSLLVWLTAGLMALIRTNHMRAPFISGDVTAIGLTQAYFAAVMSMAGAASVCNIGEEVRNPSKTILRSLILSSLVVTALYIFTNLAYFVVLDPLVIASVDATAVVFATEAWGMAGTLIIPVLASISTFGTLSAGFFCHSRLGFAASRRGHLPSFLSLVSVKSSVPVLAVFARGVLSVAFAAMGSVESVVSAILLVSGFFSLFTPLAQIRLRYTMKDVPRPITVPYVLILLSLAVNIAMVAINMWQSSDYVILIVLGTVLLAGIVAYFVLLVKMCAFPGLRGLTQFLQKLLMCQACDNNVVIDKPSVVLARTSLRRAAGRRNENKAS